MSHIIFTCTGKEWRAVLLLSLCIPELILEVRYRLTGYKSFWVLTMNVLQWSKSWLFFFLISPVKSQMLGRPVINLVWTELRISTAQYGRKLFFFVTCIHLLNREQACLTQYESGQVCRLCLCSPASGLLHAVNRVKFNSVPDIKSLCRLNCLVYTSKDACVLSAFLEFYINIIILWITIFVLIIDFVSSVGVVDLEDSRLPVWATNHVTVSVCSHKAFSNKFLCWVSWCGLALSDCMKWELME